MSISCLPVALSVELPVTLPDELPVTLPVTLPVELPVTLPVELPVTLPVELPVILPVELPVTLPVELPVTLPVALPVLVVLHPQRGPWFLSPFGTPSQLSVDCKSVNLVRNSTDSDKKMGWSPTCQTFDFDL